MGKSKDLMERLLEDFKTCGVVGEETNLLVGYLGAVSRKLDKPLGILIQSSSAAGKTSLMDAVLGFIPPEDMVRYSAMTGQSLFYMADGDLQHKILAIAEEEGAKQAGYSLKLLQSEGRISIASTGKDPHTGRHVTHDYEVRGPVMLFSTSTRVDIDEELLNRCIVLSVNEDRDQTRAIHAHQRRQRTLEGLRARSRSDRRRALHRTAQRLLRPLTVVNPFADRLTFLDDKTRTRRDHDKYLTLIDALALLHQHQRPVRQEAWDGAQHDYVEVTVEDIALANRLANEVLGRSLDELPPHTRRLLLHLDEWVAARCRELQLQRDEFQFTRRQVREALGWHDTQVRMHLDRLTELEYVLIHRGGRGQQFVYELLYQGQGRDGTPFVLGLLDVERLRADQSTTVTSRGTGQGFAPSKRAENGGGAPGSRTAVSLQLEWDFHRIEGNSSENAVLGRRPGGLSSYSTFGHSSTFQV